MQAISYEDQVFRKRLDKHYDELKWLYIELYNDYDMLSELCDHMYRFYMERSVDLKRRDERRVMEPDWFKESDMLGMMMYTDNFAGNISGVREKIPYLMDANVNCIHLMPFLDSPKEHSDGGYAVRDYRKVREDLGDMDDLRALADECHEKGINLCMDFVMNHTSDEHQWALNARSGKKEYMDRYFFFDSYDIPARFEETVPEVFPTTAPGNFTYLPEMDKYVMTTFYPYQWDLNYANPRVFNEMMYNFLFLANLGMDIIRIDAVPYIWKELGTNCRNLPKVHTIVRLMRLIDEIVCPGVALLGEVVMEPERVVPYFGTEEKPECHMLYNVTTMATLWHTVATRDARLLKNQIGKVLALPDKYTFLNYVRCHDDIGWGLDYDFLRRCGMEEVPHKKFLNNYFTGKFSGSTAAGELYNDDPVSGDARLCGTCASLCGIESALESVEPTSRCQVSGLRPKTKDKLGTIDEKLNEAVRKHIMLHAFILTLPGMPMLYSGDEVGQLNDYSYKEMPDKCADSRYVHRGSFNWDQAENRKDASSVQGMIFSELKRLEKLRSSLPEFCKCKRVRAVDYPDPHIIWIVRESEEGELHAVFNFGDEERKVRLSDENEVELYGWSFEWVIDKFLQI